MDTRYIASGVADYLKSRYGAKVKTRKQNRMSVVYADELEVVLHSEEGTDLDLGFRLRKEPEEGRMHLREITDPAFWLKFNAFFIRREDESCFDRLSIDRGGGDSRVHYVRLKAKRHNEKRIKVMSSVINYVVEPIFSYFFQPKATK